MKGHTADVKSVAFSPDGKLIASGACGQHDTAVGSPKRADPSGSRCRATTELSQHSPSARTAAASSREVRTRRFGCGIPHGGRRSANRCVATLRRWRALRSARTAGSIASGRVDRTLRLWDADTGLPVAVLPAGPSSPQWRASRSARMGAGSPRPAATTVRLWDVADPHADRRTDRGHTAPIKRGGVQPGRYTVATGSDDKTIRMWDATTGARQLVSRWPGTSPGSPTWPSTQTARGSSRPASTTPCGSGTRALPRCLSWPSGHGDGRRIQSRRETNGVEQPRPDDPAMGCGRGNPDRTAHLHRGWPGRVSELRRQVSKHVGAGFSRDGRQIVGLGLHAHRVWDAVTGRPLGAACDPAVRDRGSWPTSEEGRKFATLAGADAAVGRHCILAKGTDIQVRNEAMRADRQPPASRRTGHIIRLQPGRPTLATASEDFKVRLWDANSGRPIGNPLDHDGMIFDMDVLRGRPNSRGRGGRLGTALERRDRRARGPHVAGQLGIRRRVQPATRA